MSDPEFTSEFMRLLSRQLGQRSIDPEANLREDLGVESIDFQNLLTALEDTFRVHLEEGEVGEVETVAELRTLVEAARERS